MGDLRNVFVRSLVVSAFGAVLFGSCVSCDMKGKHRSPWDAMGDPKAASVQEMMASVVKVKNKMWIDSSEPKVLGLTEDDVMEYSGYGTGNVIDVKKGKSLVLTANHVCESKGSVDVGLFKLPVLRNELSVETVEGETFTARVVYGNSIDDVCVIEVDGVAGRPAKIAKAAPPLGADIVYSGAPGGIFSAGMVPTFIGIYVGRFIDGMVITAPAAPGASGSGVFYDGKIFGVLVMVNINFHHIVYLVNVEDVNRAVDTARDLWQI